MKNTFEEKLKKEIRIAELINKIKKEEKEVKKWKRTMQKEVTINQ
jgi:hypothetical protein